MGRKPDIYPHLNLWKNLDGVHRLLEIHTKMSGKKPGYKHNVEVLNKSAIVLLVACWEAFVEDLAEDAFSILLRRAKKHTVFSSRVLADAAKSLKDASDPRDMWKLAGDGWRQVLRSHKTTIFERYTGKLNTPRPHQVDALYESVLGIKSISRTWRWQGMKPQAAVSKLEGLIELSGSIAHRVEASTTVLKNHVRDYVDLVNRIAVQTSNAVRIEVVSATGKEPWPKFSYKSIFARQP